MTALFRTHVDRRLADRIANSNAKHDVRTAGGGRVGEGVGFD